nr:MAG TPA: hypothetical protein [Caudoviricetes sp.]
MLISILYFLICLIINVLTAHHMVLFMFHIKY